MGDKDKDRAYPQLRWGHLPILQWIPRDRDYRRVEVGALVGYDYAPWTVIDIRRDVPHPTTGEPGWLVLQLRPIDATATDGAARDRHIGYRSRGGASPHVLKPRYALCSCCGDLMPCRQTMRDRAVQSALDEMEYFGTPGICPACGDVVTTRMASETLPNVIVPGGQPVTFHAGRRHCAAALKTYRQRCTDE